MLMPILMRRAATLGAGCALISTLTLITACQKSEDTAGKGPAEIAGKQIDKATVEAGKELKQAAQKTGEVIERAGAKMQEKAREAQK
ncbi:MAG: hypothetical protein NVSMB6_27920 [Burkholderiaceae bacterium]